MFARVGFTHFLDHLSSGRFFEGRGEPSPILFLFLLAINKKGWCKA